MNIYNLSKLFLKIADTIQDPQVTSPNIVIEPSEPTMQKAVKVLQRMNPNYFIGVRKIVVAPSAQYGHVESGPNKDPTIININVQRILQESGGASAGPEAIIAAACTIAHEKGHVSSFDPKIGFQGGESPAEAEESKVRNWIESNLNILKDLLV